MRWLGDPGFRNAPEDEKATYLGPPKPFCPCDTGRPQDCKPEEWRGSHSPRPPCDRCGAQLYGHQGNYCRRPTPFAPRLDTDWIWAAIAAGARGEPLPWTKRAVNVVNEALATHAARPKEQR